MDMYVKFINAHQDEPYYKFSENDDINEIMKLMLNYKLEFPPTTAGFVKLLEIFAQDRASNVPEKERLEHICHFLGGSVPKCDSVNRKLSGTSSTGDSYETAAETIDDSTPDGSKPSGNNSFDATPEVAAIDRLSPEASNVEREGSSDSFDDPIKLSSDEIQTMEGHLAVISEDNNIRSRKRTHADVSESPSSDSSLENIADQSQLSLSSVIDSMTPKEGEIINENQPTKIVESKETVADNSPAFSQVMESPRSFLNDYVDIKPDDESFVPSMNNVPSSESQSSTLPSISESVMKTPTQSLGAKYRPTPLPRKRLPCVNTGASNSSESSKSIFNEKEEKSDPAAQNLPSHVSSCKPDYVSSTNEVALSPESSKPATNHAVHDTSLQSVASAKQSASISVTNSSFGNAVSPPSTANTSVSNSNAPSSSGIRRRFTGAAADEKIRRKREQEEKELKKL